VQVLLTGSSGWLGRFLAPRLRAAGHRAIGLDVAPGADTQVIGSVADKAVVERLFREHAIDAVIHAGALHKPDIIRVPAQFAPGDARQLKQNAAAVIARHFPDAPFLYAQRGWQLPTSIGRVYDSRRASTDLGFRCKTDFARVLDALRAGERLPFVHDPTYLSPKESRK
jgi:NAD(P)-dependent dehydrogenase (short-subunit alcohol dehydrogenase family)